jgi:hypothetical protein
MITYMLDELTNVWRWWSSFGAIIAIVMARSWLLPLVPETIAYWRGQLPRTPSRFDPGSRLVLRLAILLTMVAIALAGAILPLATNGRIDGFDQTHWVFRAGMAVTWLLLGTSAWGIVIGFSVRKWLTVTGCVLFWFAVHISLRASIGIGL